MCIYIYIYTHTVFNSQFDLYFFDCFTTFHKTFLPKKDKNHNHPRTPHHSRSKTTNKKFTSQQPKALFSSTNSTLFPTIMEVFHIDPPWRLFTHLPTAPFSHGPAIVGGTVTHSSPKASGRRCDCCSGLWLGSRFDQRRLRLGRHHDDGGRRKGHRW